MQYCNIIKSKKFFLPLSYVRVRVHVCVYVCPVYRILKAEICFGELHWIEKCLYEMMEKEFDVR